MATVQLARPLTYDDLRQMPDDRNRYEIINGELLVSPAPSRAHQLLAGALYAVVRAHVRAHRLGDLVFAPVDVRLGPHNIVEPDLLFIRANRRNIYKPKGVVEGPPDLVVEIISPSSSSIDQVRKTALYASAGVPEYWLPDPEHRTFRMLVLEDGVYHDAEPVDGRFHSTVIGGLVIDPEELFADLD